MDDECCGNCRFWVPAEDREDRVAVGQCRRGLRHVQIVARTLHELQLVDTWDWPTHYPDDWCGEHKPIDA